MSRMLSEMCPETCEWVIARGHHRTRCEIRAQMQKNKTKERTKKKTRDDKVNWRKEPSALFCNWGRGPSQAERSSTETLQRAHACMVGRCKERKKQRKKKESGPALKVLGPDRWTSYLQLRVVCRDVGVVVPAGRHTVEKHLLCSAVVVAEEPTGVARRVLIIPRLPLLSQRL